MRMKRAAPQHPSELRHRKRTASSSNPIEPPQPDQSPQPTPLRTEHPPLSPSPPQSPMDPTPPPSPPLQQTQQQPPPQTPQTQTQTQTQSQGRTQEFDLLTDKLQKTYTATTESWDQRELAHSSHVNLHWLGSIDEPIILPVIFNNKWEDIVSCSLPVYPRVVREFFKTLRFLTEGEPSIIFMWKGRNHCVSEGELGTFFNCNTTGYSPYAPYDCLTDIQQKELLDFVNDRRGTPDGNSVQLDYKHLDPDSKVLAEFIRRFLIPKGEGRGTCPSKATVLLLALQRLDQISFPRLFIKHCFWVKKVEDTHLLHYGSLITLIFTKLGLDLEGEEDEPHKLWAWDEKLLTRMRLRLEGSHYRFVRNEQTKSTPPPQTQQETNKDTNSGPSILEEETSLLQRINVLINNVEESNFLLRTLGLVQVGILQQHLPMGPNETKEERDRKTGRLVRQAANIFHRTTPPPPNQ